VNRFRNDFDPYLAAADGYPLLVLDTDREKVAIRLLLHETNVKRLYRDSRVTVLLRNGRPTAS